MFKDLWSLFFNISLVWCQVDFYGPESNRNFFSGTDGKRSGLFNPLIDYSKASDRLNKAFEKSDTVLSTTTNVCFPFLSRRVRWHSQENETEKDSSILIQRKQHLTEKEHLKNMLHEGFSSIQPLSEYVLENIRKEVKSCVFHLNHINLDFVDRNEMPAIGEAELETPQQLFGISEDIFSEDIKNQKINDQVLVMGDIFSQMSKFVIKSTVRSIFGSTFAKSHGDELSEIISTLQASCCDPLIIAYYNFFRFKMVEHVWVPSKVYEIELKKQRLYELIFREIERHVKIYQFNQAGFTSKKTILKAASVSNVTDKSIPPKTYGCYMDYVLDTLGANLSKYGNTVEHTMSLYAYHFQDLILSVHKHEVTNLSWTITHLAQDQSLQDKVRKEIYQFQDELQTQMSQLVTQKTKIEEYLRKYDHLNGVLNDSEFDEPREELLLSIHTLKKEDLDLLNSSISETPNTPSVWNDISDPYASHTSLDTIPSESIGTLSSIPSSPLECMSSSMPGVSSEEFISGSQDMINFTEEQIITGELIPTHYLNRGAFRTVSPSTPPPPKTEVLTLPNMDDLRMAASAPVQSIAKSKFDNLQIETISPDLVHKGIVQKNLLFNALFVESILISSFDKQFESTHHSGVLKREGICLRLLDACFKESTRLYSLKFMTGKTIKHDTAQLHYFNYEIQSGQYLSIVPYFSHHSKEYFPYETHAYRPERFLELCHNDEGSVPPPIQTVDLSHHHHRLQHDTSENDVQQLSIEEDRTLMNKLRVDQAFTQYVMFHVKLTKIL